MINMIRKATQNDLAIIVEMNLCLAQETEQLILPKTTVICGVQAVLDDPRKGVYWVATIDDVVVGQLLITYEWSDWRCANWWWIQSVYTLPQYRHQGIYTKLYRFIQNEMMKQDDVCGLRLGVDHNNYLAQKTYQKLGMHESNYFMYEQTKKNVFAYSNTHLPHNNE